MSEESILENIKRSILGSDDNEGRDRKFYGVTVGKVINPIDFLTLGRVQVQLPFIDSGDLSAFARVTAPMAGIFHGDYFIPNPGDEVLVAFEHGDLNAPFIIGSSWNLIQRPPLPSPLPQIRTIRTLVGNQIAFTEVPPSIAIQTPTPPAPIPMPPSPVGPHQSIMLSPAGIQVTSPTSVTVQVATSSVMVTPGSVTLTAAGSSIAITPGGVFINAPNIALNGANVSVIGGMVRINS